MELAGRYKDTVFRVALNSLGSPADADDIVQEALLRLLERSEPFESEAHEKAWLITVASNKCRDMLRFRKRHITESEELLRNYPMDSESHGVLEALTEIPEKFRIVLILHYIEGYKVDEIAEMLEKTASAIKMRLAKGRKLLKEKME